MEKQKFSEDARSAIRNTMRLNSTVVAPYKIKIRSPNPKSRKNGKIR